MKDRTDRFDEPSAPSSANEAESQVDQLQVDQLQLNDRTLADRHEARLSRVLDYQASSLAKEDALEANLGSMNSGLMRMALWLDEAIEQAMESGPRTVERLPQISPAIDTVLRVTRQVDRFAQIERRTAEARDRKAKNDAPAAPRPEANAAAKTSQSEDSSF